MSHKASLNSCDYYIGLSVLYNLQGIIYPQGIINQVIQMILILWGLYYLVKVAAGQKMPMVLKSVLCLLLMYAIYGGTSILLGEVYRITAFHSNVWTSPMNYLKGALNSLLPFFPLYYYSKTGKFTIKRLNIYIFILITTIVALYFKNLRHQEEEFFRSQQEEFTNNIGYEFCAIIPLILFIPRKIWQYVLLIISLTFTLICMKRGAIAIAAILAVWFLVINIAKTRGAFQKIKLIGFGLLVVVAAQYALVYQYDKSPYFRLRIEETLKGNSSGRDQLAHDIIKNISSDTSALHFFLGRGANSTVVMAGNYAHNDWLELMANNGVLGVLLGAFFYISLFFSFFKIKKYIKPLYCYAYLMACTALFLATFFSMSLADMEIWNIMPIAFVMGDYQRITSSKINSKPIRLSHVNYK